MKAYSAIDPSGGVSASLRAARAPASSHMAVWAIDGQEVRKMSGSELDRANMEKFGETSQRMTWYDFQTALRSHVPDGTVHINHHLDQFTQDASGVTVSFNGGETVVRCGILLGADGVYSQIRRQLTASRCASLPSPPLSQLSHLAHRPAPRTAYVRIS